MSWKLRDMQEDRERQVSCPAHPALLWELPGQESLGQMREGGTGLGKEARVCQKRLVMS